MREIYATPHKGKPERLEVAVVEAEVLLCHNDNRWIRLRPSTAQALGELLLQAAAEARESRRPKTDEELNASFGNQTAKAESVSGEPRPAPPTLTSGGDGDSVAQSDEDEA
jgi:hypothetical protein